MGISQKPRILLFKIEKIFDTNLSHFYVKHFNFFFQFLELVRIFIT